MIYGVTLADAVPEACRIADKLVRRATERVREAGETVSCRVGCAACCRYLVGLSVPEALHLANLVSGGPGGRRLRRRFGEARAALAEAGLLEPLRVELLGGDEDDAWDLRVRALSRRYAERRLACPLLEAERCALYADRPAPCRQYLVTSRAELCADPESREVRRVPVAVHVGDVLADLAAEFTGEPVRKVALPLALEFAASRPDLATRRWPREELFARLRRPTTWGQA